MQPTGASVGSHEEGQTLALTLQHPPDDLEGMVARSVDALRVLNSTTKIAGQHKDYVLFFNPRTRRSIRPIRTSMFIDDPDQFQVLARAVCSALAQRDANSNGPSLNALVYTIAQAHGAMFDSFLGPNAAKKSTGIVLSALVRNTLASVGMHTRRVQVPITTDAGVYKAKLETVASALPGDASLREADLIVECMNTTKDRLTQVFSDKILLERWLEHRLDVAAVALHDVQRKGASNVHPTLSGNRFEANWGLLGGLRALYYVDVPPNASALAASRHVKPFSDLIFECMAIVDDVSP